MHREVSSALLKSALQTPGDKKALARRVGISPQYLSYLQNPHDERTADPHLAKKICAALPLEPEQRESLFEHLVLANQRRLEARRLQRIELQQRPLEDIAEVLGQLHHQAGTASDPQVSKHNYQIVRDAAREALAQLPLPARPALVAQLCFLVHDAQCVLNRPDDALYHAKLARVI